MKIVTLTKLLYRRFVHRDDEASLYLLARIARILIPGYRLHFPQLDWWRDDEFNGYLHNFGELEGFNTDRKWMVYQLARLARDVDGDTAECGVFLGASSYLMCLANLGTAKTHHVFDSFEGISAPSDADRRDYWKAGMLAAPLDSVKRALAEFPRVEFYKGWIPDRFGEVNDRIFSFVHVDVDLAQPTSDSLVFFYPRLAAGGVFVCDDYGFDTCPGATRGIDDFLADKKEKMLALSGGGGFFIKGRSVAPKFSLSAREQPSSKA